MLHLPLEHPVVLCPCKHPVLKYPIISLFFLYIPQPIKLPSKMEVFHFGGNCHTTEENSDEEKGRQPSPHPNKKQKKQYIIKPAATQSKQSSASWTNRKILLRMPCHYLTHYVRELRRSHTDSGDCSPVVFCFVFKSLAFLNFYK